MDMNYGEPHQFDIAYLKTMETGRTIGASEISSYGQALQALVRICLLAGPGETHLPRVLSVVNNQNVGEKLC